MIFCTLFDSNYLDKGLALYKSLKSHTKTFKIYILTMDEKSNDILNSLHLENVVIIELFSFIKKMKLEKAYKNRTKAEFCWTCTSHLIDYVLTIFNEKICTYIDSDLYFYSDPSCLIDEIGKKTVQIVEHRFTNSLSDKFALQTSGKYCVQFNTFKNEKNALDLLRWWEAKCIESCSQSGKDGVMGEQYYLNGWEKYNFVSILKNLGGGVAPWNIGQYRLVNKVNDAFFLKKRSIVFKLVFYHFHNISYLSKTKANIAVFHRRLRTDKKLVEKIYFPYLTELNQIKRFLNKEYGFYPMITKHPGFKNTNNKTKNRFLNSIGKSGFIGTSKILFLKVRNKILILLNGKKNIVEIKDDYEEWSI